jgi:hypothetical protein
MKKIVFGLLLAGCFAAWQPARAQTGASIGYGERVPEEAVDKAVLYRRAYDWIENHFPYTPKTVIRADTAKGEVRVEGMAKVKTSAPSGQLQERHVRFEFAFRTSPTGYDYSVGSFKFIADPGKPDEATDFDVFVALLTFQVR